MTATTAAYLDDIERLRSNLRRVIMGKDQSVEILIIALLAGGSVLLEDIPGVGKTTLAKALARSIQADFRRIQFTPDLLPADILGSSIYNPVSGQFSFQKGPIFCNVLLADEINRASPRTQSALLEAMNEQQASIDGISYPLPEPFVILATQNPIDFHGTYPLPEAQLDRFLVMLDLGYPTREVEVEIMQSRAHNDPLIHIEPVMDGARIHALQREVMKVGVEKTVSRYIVDLTHATRQDDRLKLGVSPRGSLMLSRSAQAMAFVKGRDYVMPDDVQEMAGYVLPHRVILTAKTRYDGMTKHQIVQDVIRKVPVPV